MKVLVPILLILIVGCSSQTAETDFSDLPPLEIEHRMEISESEEFLLGSITNLLVDSEGDIILVDGMQRFVYAIDSDGEFIQQTGKQGSGPGEYEYPGMMVLSDHNNLHLFDYGSRSVITYAKENGRWDYDSAFDVNFSQYGFFSMFFPADDQEFYVITNPMMASDIESKTVVRKINNSGEVIQDSIYAYPQNERFMVMNNGVPSMAMTIPNMHRQGRFNVDYDGNLYFGWSDSLTIFRQKPGESNFDPVVNINANNLPFTDAAKDTVLNNYENILSGNNQARRDLISSFPDTKPIFDEYQIDDQGGIWVQIFNREEDTEWIIFSEEGEPMYNLSLPERNRLITIRHGNIYTVGSTAEGLPVVNVYTILS